MGLFKSREEKEREAAIASLRRTAEIYGQCLADVVGNEVLGSFWMTVGALLQQAVREGFVFVRDDKEFTAALFLCNAGLFKRHLPDYRTFEITSAGEGTAKRVFHLS